MTRPPRLVSLSGGRISHRRARVAGGTPGVEDGGGIMDEETTLPPDLRRGASWQSQLALVCLLIASAMGLAWVVGDVWSWAESRLGILLALGGFTIWRWGWASLHAIRALVYRYLVYPRIRRKALAAERARGSVPEVIILAVTYKEQPWITAAVFESIFRELRTLDALVRPPKVVVATGCDEDDAKVRQAYARSCAGPRQPGQGPWPPELVLLRGDNGKRPAIAAALRAIAAANPLPDGVVIFMDGDTIMGPGLLRKILPVFRIAPEVAALTTNEDALIKSPAWFAEWITMRFGLRHLYMCSVALSDKLLCLTGRLSAFRGSVASDPTFLDQIERDGLTHWLWGPYQMLSGDDKSTWYWLAARGLRMLYIPDAMATTVEVVQGSAVRRAIANMRRWSGNSLRNSYRVIAIGPGRLGLFPWWCVVDQRICMWTSMIGPVGCLIALSRGLFDVAAGYGLFVLATRTVRSAVSWRHGRRFSAFYVPLMALSEWTNAVIKIWTSFHPVKQSWLNRGGRTLDSSRGSGFRRLRSGFALYLYGFSVISLITLVGTNAGLFPLLEEAPLFWRRWNARQNVEAGVYRDPAVFSAADLRALGGPYRYRSPSGPFLHKRKPARSPIQDVERIASPSRHRDPGLQQ